MANRVLLLGNDLSRSHGGGGIDSAFHHTCNKGQAIAHLAGQLGMEMSQTVCIGDNRNDVETLAMANCGFAVANGAPGVAPYAATWPPATMRPNW